MATEVDINPEIPGMLAAYKQAAEREKNLTLPERLAFQLRRNASRLMLAEPPHYAMELLEELKDLLLTPPAEYPANTVFCIVDSRNRPMFKYGFGLTIGSDRLGVGFQSPRLTIERRKIEGPIIQVHGDQPPTVLIPDDLTYSIPLIKKGSGSLKWVPDTVETGPVAIVPEVNPATIWLGRVSTYIHRNTFWDRDFNFPFQSTMTVNSRGDLVTTLTLAGSIQHPPTNNLYHKPKLST